MGRAVDTAGLAADHGAKFCVAHTRVAFKSDPVDCREFIDADNERTTLRDHVHAFEKTCRTNALGCVIQLARRDSLTLPEL